MTNKIHIATNAFLFTSLLLLQGCQTPNARNIEATQSTQKKSNSITAENFLALSQYHYYRQSMISKNDKKPRAEKTRRAYPGAIEPKEDKSILKVRTLKSSNEEIEKLQITQNGSKIEIKVTENLVVVTFNNKDTSTTKTFTKEEFNNINKGLI